MLFLTVPSGLGKSYLFANARNLSYAYCDEKEMRPSGLIELGKFLLWLSDWDSLPAPIAYCNDEQVIRVMLEWMEKRVADTARNHNTTGLWRGYGDRHLVSEHLNNGTLIPVGYAYKPGHSIIVCKDKVLEDLSDHWLKRNSSELKESALSYHTFLLEKFHNDAEIGIKLESGEFLFNVFENGLLEEVMDESYNKIYQG